LRETEDGVQHAEGEGDKGSRDRVGGASKGAQQMKSRTEMEPKKLSKVKVAEKEQAGGGD
jgi:hypothetical protein